MWENRDFFYVTVCGVGLLPIYHKGFTRACLRKWDFNSTLSFFVNCRRSELLRQPNFNSMKNLCRLAIIAIAAMLTGCGVTGFNAANVEETQTQVKIAEGNFRVIKNVEGFSSATYILGIGGLSKEATRENAVADMFEKTHLTGSQTIANIHTKQHIASFLGLYIRVSYYAYGQVIEFNRSTAVNSPSANIASTASKTSSYKYKVGDYYDDGMKEGVIFEVSDDGMHGKILQYAGKSQWSNMKQTNGC